MTDHKKLAEDLWPAIHHAAVVGWDMENKTIEIIAAAIKRVQAEAREDGWNAAIKDYRDKCVCMYTHREDKP